jgi:hypothetical protein
VGFDFYRVKRVFSSPKHVNSIWRFWVLSLEGGNGVKVGGV